MAAKIDGRAAQAQHAISGYTHTVPDDCETLHWRGNILSMNELASVAQPAVGEEIHIHIEGQDVLTLPLASSGMDAPRFVVHVPAQAQPVVNQQMTTAASDVLADTQRAIIEAAERRGYARAIAECGQDREDVHDIEAAAKTLAECMDYPWEPMSEQGREAMRKHAKRVIDAARAAKGGE